MVPVTARRYFDDDIGRASALLVQASKLHNGGATRLATDFRSASVAMAVGAMDAYLCDKYVDCLTSVLREYRCGSWPGNLPRFYAKQQLPAGEVLDTSRAARPLWAIRMAARSVMEKDNMLSISRIKDHFNPILPSGQKIWVDFLPRLLSHNLQVLTGPLTATQIAALRGAKKNGSSAELVGEFQSHEQ